MNAQRINFGTQNLTIWESRFASLGSRRFEVTIGERFYYVTLHPNFPPIIKRPCGRGYTQVKPQSITWLEVMSTILFPGGMQ